MTDTPPLTILIADSHDVSRGATASLLRASGHTVLQAIDGASAIKVVQEHPVHLAIFHNTMHPIGGYDFARYIHAGGYDIPLIMISDEQTSDQLGFAASLGIRHILAMPVDPNRLTAMIDQIIHHEHKKNPHPKITVSAKPASLTPDQAMARAIDLAHKNATGKFGGPFACVILDPDGHVIGEGVNLPTSRFDPIAHAEVMAIRKATEHLQQPHLEGCTLYSTSEPTRLAMALIESVGIHKIVYGLSHAELKGDTPISRPHHKIEIERLAEHDVAKMIAEVRGA